MSEALWQEGTPHAILDGSVSASRRHDLIQSFQKSRKIQLDPSRPAAVVQGLLISIRAGGLGLNLSVASHVFLMEPSWNPAREDQAVDRAHRLGKLGATTVTRFILKDTVEQRVLDLQNKKRRLAKNIMDGPVTDNGGTSRRGSGSGKSGKSSKSGGGLRARDTNALPGAGGGGVRGKAGSKGVGKGAGKGAGKSGGQVSSGELAALFGVVA